MTWYDFASVINNYLKKVDLQKEQMRKFDSDNKAAKANNKKRK